MTRYVFKMPDLGEGTVEAEIVAWHVKVGDRIVIRIRAAGGLDLNAVETTPAKRVADREPKAQEANQNAQA